MFWIWIALTMGCSTFVGFMIGAQLGTLYVYQQYDRLGFKRPDQIEKDRAVFDVEERKRK